MFPEKQAVASNLFMSGGGEMGDRIRAFDWSETSLGSPDNWPQSLHTTLSIVLNSSFPMFLFWGDDMVSFYNDAFRPSLGNEGKHPSSLGKRGKEVWPEIWHIIGPMLHKVLYDGEAVYNENLLIPFYRNGQLEDTFWTFSYSPVYDETRKPAGIFVTCTETTENIRILNEVEENKNQLHFAIEAAELGTWDYDPSTNKMTASQRLKEWFGIGVHDAFDLDLALMVVAERDRERVRKSIQDALTFSASGSNDLIYTIVHPETQQERVVQAKGRAWFNEDKIAYRFNGTVQDITEQTRMQEALGASEKRWRTLANLVPSYTFTASQDGSVNYLSDKWYEFTGIKIRRNLDEDFFSVLHPDDLEKTRLKWKHAVLTNVALEDEIRWKRFDGEYRWMVYRIEPVESPAGRIDLWFGSAMDITEIKRTEQALRESERSFQHLIMKVPSGIAVFYGPEFTVGMANERYLEIVDRKESQLVGKPLFEVLPETKDPIEAILQNVLQTGEPYEGQEFPVKLNRYGKSELTYFNFIYQPIRDTQGETTGVVVVANDVTELVKAKLSVAESEKQFRNMIMQSPVAMAIFRGEEHVIEMANKSMLKRIWQKRESDVIGKKALEVFPELRDQKYPSLLKKVLREGKSHREYDSIAYVQRNDGLKTFFLDFEYRPLFETNGSVSAVMISVYDVTEKVEARRKVEEVVNELEVFKFVADNVTDFIGISDLNGKPVYINKSGLRKVGLKSFDKISRSDFFFDEDREFIEKEFLPGVQRDGTGETEVRFRHFVTGEPIWMLYNVIRVHNISGELFGFATISKDVTSQKEWMTELERKVEERTVALREANKQLARSNEDLQQFAHVASHDLKEPVRKIKLYTSRLHDEYSEVIGKAGNTYLDKVLDSTERMYAMINGVLNYSTMAALEQPFVSVSLTGLLREIEKDLELLISEKKAKIDYNDTLPDIKGIPDLLYQLFYNLINNSLKFSKQNEPARIRISHMLLDIQDKHYYRITLEDNGIGFDNASADNIFATFIRLNSKEKYEGTGLGLSLCKKIVQRHGGLISAKGEQGKGAEFNILFPS